MFQDIVCQKLLIVLRRFFTYLFKEMKMWMFFETHCIMLLRPRCRSNYVKAEKGRL